jgi:hypothetical protein
MIFKLWIGVLNYPDESVTIPSPGPENTIILTKV